MAYIGIGLGLGLVVGMGLVVEFGLASGLGLGLARIPLLSKITAGVHCPY